MSRFSQHMSMACRGRRSRRPFSRCKSLLHERSALPRRGVSPTTVARRLELRTRPRLIARDAVYAISTSLAPRRALRAALVTSRQWRQPHTPSTIAPLCRAGAFFPLRVVTSYRRPATRARSNDYPRQIPRLAGRDCACGRYRDVAAEEASPPSGSAHASAGAALSGPPTMRCLCRLAWVALGQIVAGVVE